MTKEYDGCDGILWYVEEKENEVDIDATIYRYQDRFVEPDDLGYKYHILTFKEKDLESAEVMNAYIGDVAHFVKVRASLGYNGLMVKQKIIPKKTVKQMFTKILESGQFSGKTIKWATKQL